VFALAAVAAVSADILRDATAAFPAGDMYPDGGRYREFLSDHPNAAEIRSNLLADCQLQTGRRAPQWSC
jgi:hypothetical protein